jgi:hypothetical protein
MSTPLIGAGPITSTATLPDVGAPMSLLFMAVLGLLILAAGIVAMLVTRRP